MRNGKNLQIVQILGGFIVYVETTSFRIDKGSGLVKMWILYDFKTSQEGYQVPYLSMRIQRQYDCKQERARMLAQSFFGDHMAKGDVISTESPEGTWMPVGPGTIGKSLWELACSNSKS